ncbi:hypothetical protein [Thioalkalivibrio sp. ALE16]|uniref:hypothetical protein n=1 Tax=Thioalkalivibrio sp. ALE16 TaxID=1158172 RepID=UPI0012DE71EA|nr:hypothetical protein [Thioalkalivibrio sp. ALE16]
MKSVFRRIGSLLDTLEHFGDQLIEKGEEYDPPKRPADKQKEYAAKKSAAYFVVGGESTSE